MKETNSLLTLVICLMMLLTISLPLTMIVKLASGDIGSYADDYTTRSSLTLRPTEDRPEWQDAKMHYPQLPDPDGWDVRDMCFSMENSMLILVHCGMTGCVLNQVM